MAERAGTVENRLAAAGLVLPDVAPHGTYAVASRHRDMVWTAGQLSRVEGGVVTGVARGPDDLLSARQACEIAVLRAIAAVRTVAPLEDVQAVLILRGFIASTATFTQHSQALDAASQVLRIAFGAAADSCARSAIGVSSLPSGGLAELELTVVVVVAVAVA